MNNDWTEVGGTNTQDRSETWNPEVQKQIEGVYVEHKSNVGKRSSNLYILETEDGKKVAVWGSAVIDNRMANFNLGDTLRIVYEGRSTNPKNGHTIKNFRFFRKNQTAPKTEDDIPF